MSDEAVLTPSIIRFHLLDDEKTYWTLMVKEDTTADEVTRQIASKVNNGVEDESGFSLLAFGGNDNKPFVLTGPKPLLSVQHELEKEKGSCQFKVREELVGVGQRGSTLGSKPLQGLRNVKRLQGKSMKLVGDTLKRKMSLSLRRTSSSSALPRKSSGNGEEGGEPGKGTSKSSSSLAKGAGGTDHSQSNPHSRPKSTGSVSVPKLSLGSSSNATSHLLLSADGSLGNVSGVDVAQSQTSAGTTASAVSNGGRNRVGSALSSSSLTSGTSSEGNESPTAVAGDDSAQVSPDSNVTRFVQRQASSGNTCGWMKKSSKQRYFVLDASSTLLLWYEAEVASPAAAAAAGQLPRGSLSLLRYTRADNYDTELRIWAPDEPKAKPYFATAHSPSVAKYWVDALRSVVRDALMDPDFERKLADAPLAKATPTTTSASGVMAAVGQRVRGVSIVGGGDAGANGHSSPDLRKRLVKRLSSSGQSLSDSLPSPAASPAGGSASSAGPIGNGGRGFRGSMIISRPNSSSLFSSKDMLRDDPSNFPGYAVEPHTCLVYLGTPNAAAMKAELTLPAKVTAEEVVEMLETALRDRGMPVSRSSGRVLAGYKPRRQTDLSNATLRMRQFRHAFSPNDRVVRMVRATDATLVVEEPVRMMTLRRQPLRTTSMAGTGQSIFDQSAAVTEEDNQDDTVASVPVPPPAPNDDLADLLGGDSDDEEPELLFLGAGAGGVNSMPAGNRKTSDEMLQSMLAGINDGNKNDDDDEFGFGGDDIIATFMHRDEAARDGGATQHFDAANAQRLVQAARTDAQQEKKVARDEAFQAASQLRRRIVQELRDTEQNYVASLEFVICRALQPLRQAIGTKHQLLSKEELHVVFGNIESIYQIALVLLEDLRSLLSDWQPTTCVSSALLQLAPYMQSYAEYNQTYESANSLLGRRSESSRNFRGFLARIKDLKEANQLDLPSLLIMPIQRLPRYVLLLEQLIKRTPENHPDLAGCNNAVAVIRAVADKADKWVSQLSQRQQLMRIVKDLGGGRDAEALIAPHRQFVLEASFVRLLDAEGSRTTRVKLYLFNDVLVVAKTSKKSTVSAVGGSNGSTEAGTSSTATAGSHIKKRTGNNNASSNSKRLSGTGHVAGKGANGDSFDSDLGTLQPEDSVELNESAGAAALDNARSLLLDDGFGEKHHLTIPLHLCWVKNIKFTPGHFEILTPLATRSYLLKVGGRQTGGVRDEWVARLAELTADDTFRGHQAAERSRLQPEYDIYPNQLDWDSAWCLPCDPRDLPRRTRVPPAVCTVCHLHVPKSKIVDDNGLDHFLCESCLGKRIDSHLASR